MRERSDEHEGPAMVMMEARLTKEGPEEGKE